MTVLLVLGITVPSMVLRELVEATLGSGPLADVSRIAVPMAVTAWLAPRVSYRRRDALLWLIPPAGLVVFVVIAWRLAFLAYRDWSPRPDEVPRVRRDPRHAGLWHLSATG
ncbi:hypothetical protein K7640_15335 [Micromonospora sp. PLK6-60]|nr:hypothetical protein [Micromonospora sp. PLK6-60]